MLAMPRFRVQFAAARVRCGGDFAGKFAGTVGYRCLHSSEKEIRAPLAWQDARAVRFFDPNGRQGGKNRLACGPAFFARCCCPPHAHGTPSPPSNAPKPPHRIGTARPTTRPRSCASRAARLLPAARYRHQRKKSQKRRATSHLKSSRRRKYSQAAQRTAAART